MDEEVVSESLSLPPPPQRERESEEHKNFLKTKKQTQIDI